MRSADSSSLLLTESDWKLSPRTKTVWQLDLGRALAGHAAGSHLRLSLFGAKRVVWWTADRTGEVSGPPTDLLKAAIPIEYPLVLTLEVRAKHPPLMTCAHMVRLATDGISQQFLPVCGQRRLVSHAVEIMRLPRALPPADDLVELARTSDSAMVEMAARSLLENDAPETGRHILDVLARVARNRTPDGLIDLMTHLGSGKRQA